MSQLGVGVGVGIPGLIDDLMQLSSQFRRWVLFSKKISESRVQSRLHGIYYRPLSLNEWEMGDSTEKLASAFAAVNSHYQLVVIPDSIAAARGRYSDLCATAILAAVSTIPLRPEWTSEYVCIRGGLVRVRD